MTKFERWLTSIAIVAGILPLILLAFMVKLIPLNVGELPLLAEGGYYNRYTYLVSGLFCIVPLGIVMIARYIKHKMAVYDNYIAILCVSILLSLSFAVVALYGTITEIEDIYVLSRFDFLGFGVTVVSIATALCGNLTRYKTPSSRIAIKNKDTASSPEVFKAVHQTAASVQIIAFVSAAVAASLIDGIYALIVFASVSVLFLAWCRIFSHFCAVVHKKRREDFEDAMQSQSSDTPPS